MFTICICNAPNPNPEKSVIRKSALVSGLNLTSSTARLASNALHHRTLHHTLPKFSSTPLDTCEEVLIYATSFSLSFDESTSTPEPANMSSAALNKIAPNSPSRAKPSEVEQAIATALFDLQESVPEMKAALRPLQFVSAREVR